MKIVAEFDKPYDALLILLKDELQANLIEFEVTGEKGSDIQYNSLTFDIKVIVDDNDFDSAISIYNRLNEQIKQNQ